MVLNRVVFLVLFFAAGMAAPLSFLQAADFQTVSAEELKKLVDSKSAIVVDARTAPEFAEGHIPGSINVPPEKVRDIASFLPKDKKVLVVTYCRGVT